MQDLIDITNNVHYENYRCRKLASVANDGKSMRISNKWVNHLIVLNTKFLA